MTTSAVFMMVVAMVVLWGGLGLAILSLARTRSEEPDEVRRDL